MSGSPVAALNKKQTPGRLRKSRDLKNGYNVSPRDPATMAAVAGLASCVPARRATKIDPVVALRYE